MKRSEIQEKFITKTPYFAALHTGYISWVFELAGRQRAKELASVWEKKSQLFGGWTAGVWLEE